ncbi:hypothetical protein IAQ61_008279 [Plenodomus lingam]|uniref:uncharacterized protein n=1 Tax=Leptosphaeria maculans TaxID=5022 RepID=UPI00332EA74A|nr:hypothetical protein IAQ61_008279 [Plenodomus lingam]
MEDWADFQQRARAVLPAQELKPKRCWIGVLSHEKKPTDRLRETDFLWMVGHSKITTQKIYETYQKHFNVDGLELKHKGVSVQPGDVVKSFQTAGDNLVLFLASRPEKGRTPPESFASTDLLCKDSKEFQADILHQSEDSPGAHLVSRTMSIPFLDGPSEMKVSALKCTPNSAPVEHEIPPRRAVPDPLTVKSPDTFAPWTPFGDQAEVANRAPVPAQVPYQTPYTSPYPFGMNQILPANLPNAGPTGSLAPPGLALFGAHAQCENYGSATSHGQTMVKSEQQLPLLHTESSSIHSAEDHSTPSFNSEEIFQNQPLLEGQEEVTTMPQQDIREIIDQRDPLILEAGVSKAVEVLKELRARFAQHAATNNESASWVQAIDKLLPQAQRLRTVVGVVGNTGAGKSSVINALLDEERLVPTNCMRACTAVVTEISWNASTDSSDRYRAEIEFIGHADWEKELHMLLKEFLTDNGTLLKDVSDPNSDAGIAWARFHSVYPDIPRDSIGDCTVPNLMAKPSIATILGSTKRIAAAVSGRFYNKLQKYVDSREKVTKKNKDKDKKTAFQMEYWPLIKVVKIYTKSPALSTGACIVDLPGVHDSNAARAAVAQGYMKRCTGLWIVAPINRAVDDKAAKTLLGNSFKRQLKYDGGFSSITFICSKTDDISITEAIDSLELEDEIAEFEREQVECKNQIKKIENDISKLRDEQAHYKLVLNDTIEEIEEWEDLQDLIDDGKTVYSPLLGSKKRKRPSSGKQSRKKVTRDDGDSEDNFVATDDEETEDDEAPVDESQQTPLSEADIKLRLKELKDVKKEARRAAFDKKHEMDALEPQIQELAKKIDGIKAKISRICIAGRNQYSKTAIQNDFAAGIKEIDQENAAEEDEDNFNPEEEVRDYDQVAKSLPVFCVSSRAYQKIQGRLLKDDSVPGFITVEETEIPQLQAHCKKLTESGRIQTARTFLLNLCQLLTTFHLWASDDGTGLKMTDEDKAKQVSYLKRRLEQLETGLEQAVHACINEMRAELKNQIFNKCPELINDAIQAAPTTALAWGQKDMGGLAWSTYKAVVRRDGVYQSPSAGLRDFNADLIDPIIKKLASGWERAFQSRLPKAFNTYVKNSSKILQAFHTAVEENARKNGVGLASLTMLKTQIHTYEQLYADLGTHLVTQMNELQREANREFTPSIAGIMHAVYEACTVERGRGSYKRMKEHMMNHVERERHHMFHDATKTVERHLDQMCKALQESMEAKADEIFVQMNRDYMQALAGREINGSMMLQGREERAARKESRELLMNVDEQFANIVNGHLDMGAGEYEDKASVIMDDEHDISEDAQDVSVYEDNEDSVMTGVDDALITELNPSKSTARPGSECPNIEVVHQEDDTEDDN